MDEVFYWPEVGSTTAKHVDSLFNILNSISVFFIILIVGCLIYFSVKYRRGAVADRSNPPDESPLLEVVWTGIPILIVLGIFTYSAYVYIDMVRAPEDSMPVYVVGKQWMWKIQHPEGRWENNELHVPVGRNVQLIMTAEDVIHSFFVPAFRVKQDVVPGRYTSMWFKATEVGTHHLFCAEYCGTNHSRMVGTIHIMEPEDYQRWLAEGNTGGSMAQQGEQLFRELGCGGCHGPGANVRAPLLDGLYNNPVPIEGPDGTTKVIIGDERYIHDSIVNPAQEIAAGYKPIMPSFRDQLDESEVRLLVEYIKSLGTASTGRGGGAKSPNPPSAPNSVNAPLSARPEKPSVNRPAAGATTDLNVRTSDKP